MTHPHVRITSSLMILTLLLLTANLAAEPLELGEVTEGMGDAGVPQGLVLTRLSEREGHGMHVATSDAGHIAIATASDESVFVELVSPERKVLGEWTLDIEGHIHGLWLEGNDPVIVMSRFEPADHELALEAVVVKGEGRVVRERVLAHSGRDTRPKAIWRDGSVYLLAFEEREGTAILLFHIDTGLQWEATLTAEGTITSCIISPEGAVVLVANSKPHDRFGNAPDTSEAVMINAEGELIGGTEIPGRHARLIAADSSAVFVTCLRGPVPEVGTFYAMAPWGEGDGVQIAIFDGGLSAGAMTEPARVGDGHAVTAAIVDGRFAVGMVSPTRLDWTMSFHLAQTENVHATVEHVASVDGGVTIVGFLIEQDDRDETQFVRQPYVLDILLAEWPLP